MTYPDFPVPEPTRPTRLNPYSAHHIDGRILLALLPHLDQSDLMTIRSEFGYYLAGRGGMVATWQEAWNAWTRATEHRDGEIAYTPTRCSTCRGRRISTRNVARNISRTGSPYVCGECNGSGRGRRTRQRARYVRVPESEQAQQHAEQKAE